MALEQSHRVVAFLNSVRVPYLSISLRFTTNSRASCEINIPMMNNLSELPPSADLVIALAMRDNSQISNTSVILYRGRVLSWTKVLSGASKYLTLSSVSWGSLLSQHSLYLGQLGFIPCAPIMTGSTMLHANAGAIAAAVIGAITEMVTDVRSLQSLQKVVEYAETKISSIFSTIAQEYSESYLGTSLQQALKLIPESVLYGTRHTVSDVVKNSNRPMIELCHKLDLATPFYGSLPWAPMLTIVQDMQALVDRISGMNSYNDLLYEVLSILMYAGSESIAPYLGDSSDVEYLSQTIGSPSTTWGPVCKANVIPSEGITNLSISYGMLTPTRQAVTDSLIMPGFGVVYAGGEDQAIRDVHVTVIGSPQGVEIGAQTPAAQAYPELYDHVRVLEDEYPRKGLVVNVDSNQADWSAVVGNLLSTVRNGIDQTTAVVAEHLESIYTAIAADGSGQQYIDGLRKMARANYILSRFNADVTVSYAGPIFPIVGFPGLVMAEGDSVIGMVTSHTANITPDGGWSNTIVLSKTREVKDQSVSTLLGVEPSTPTKATFGKMSDPVSLADNDSEVYSDAEAFVSELDFENDRQMAQTLIRTVRRRYTVFDPDSWLTRLMTTDLTPVFLQIEGV